MKITLVKIPLFCFGVCLSLRNGIFYFGTHALCVHWADKFCVGCKIPLETKGERYVEVCKACAFHAAQHIAAKRYRPQVTQPGSLTLH